MERRAAYIVNFLTKSQLQAKLDVPEIANHVPHVQIDWEGKLPASEVVR